MTTDGQHTRPILFAISVRVDTHTDERHFKVKHLVKTSVFIQLESNLEERKTHTRPLTLLNQSKQSINQWKEK